LRKDWQTSGHRRQGTAGDRLRGLGSCGSGYRDPLIREPTAMLDDVLDGFMSEDSPGGATAWSLSMGGSMSNDSPTARRPHAG
jgi:hypothetical protein